MPKRYLMIAGTFLLTVLLYIDRACISAAKGPVVEDLELTDDQWGWVLAAFSLGYALFQTPSGIVADRLGPRRVLAAVVTFWSLFTALTGAAWNFVSLLASRLLFGVGEAGAFPGCARAIYSWIPMGERGIVQGINFSGSRLGAAFAFPLVAWLVGELGWRGTFVLLGVGGLLWPLAWYAWFRDEPEDKSGMSPEELRRILEERQSAGASGEAPPLSAGVLFASRNLFFVMAQYFASNYTFFFCLTWLFPYLKETYALSDEETGIYTATPFIFGAVGNWVAGGMVDAIYRRGNWVLSRRLTAIIGFALAALGVVAGVYMETPAGAVACFSVAVFGADMTLSPSWSVCIDIGRRHSGAVSGTMNMAGNLGSFVTALVFPYLKGWTGSHVPFFWVAAVLNVLAIGAWMAIRPDRPLEEY